MKKVWLLALALTSCAPTLNPTNRTVIHGVPVTYEVVSPGTLPPGMIGEATPTPFGCRVRIDQAHVNMQNVAHELGHCLDGGRSRTFGRTGCVLRAYACDPREGYADTYALVAAFCLGQDLGVLGWPGGAPGRPPAPESVTPELLQGGPWTRGARCPG
ncbi:hypothetical protein [Deinococcus aluminii]|uniref:Lipoprotein n=1 Tax=Deinococcus aluminii TaxID=1656885 RepID=A0ABP9XG68_9DEIO